MIENNKVIGKTYNIGLKLWSTNENYIEEAAQIFDQGLFQYIELYAVPNSHRECISIWKKLHIPFVIHAPHSSHGLDLSDSFKIKSNRGLVEEAIRYADALKAKYIILHPGINGTTNENIHQINVLKDNRLIIENMPYFTMEESGTCNGNSYPEIKMILEDCNIGFCLDIGHSIYAANALKKDPLAVIDEFMKLKPQMYHLSDGDYDGLRDQHANLSEGSFNLKKILDKICSHSMITLETPKKNRNSLNDFITDVTVLDEITGLKKHSNPSMGRGVA